MTKEQTIQSVVCMLAVDGYIDELELEFLDRFARQIGVTQPVVDKALKHAKDGCSSVHLPEDSAKKRRLLTMLARAAVANKKVVHEERQMIHSVAKKMGLPPTEAERALAIWLKKSTETETSGNGSGSQLTVKAANPETRYNVVFSGELKEGHAKANVQKNLAQLYKTTPQAIEKLFTQPKAIIKQRVSRELAEQCQQAFARAGAICSIEPLAEQRNPAKPSAAPTQTAHKQKVPKMKPKMVEAASDSRKKPIKKQHSASQKPTSAAVSPSPDSEEASPQGRLMTCPKCGQEQPKSQRCESCGIFITSYLKILNRKEHELEVNDGQEDEYSDGDTAADSYIPGRDDAIAQVQETAKWLFIGAGATLISCFFEGWWGILDVMILALLGVTLSQYYSRTAAIATILYAAFSLLSIVFSFQFRGILLSGVLLYSGIRTIGPAFKLHKDLAEPDFKMPVMEYVLSGILILGMVSVIGVVGAGWFVVNQVENFVESEFSELLMAAGDGNIDDVQGLLDDGADANQAGGIFGFTPLIAATANGHLEVVELLLEHGADVNAQDASGLTALGHAQNATNKEMADLLLSYGADPEIRPDDSGSNYGDTAIKAMERMTDTLDKVQQRDTGADLLNE